LPAPLIPHRLAGTGPALHPLDGAALVVQPVLNVESWPFDQPMPRKLLTAPHGREHIPDVPNYSWVEYGMRVGVRRIVDAFSARGLPMGLSVNAGVAEDYPAVFALLAGTGWDFVAHGIRQASVHGNEHELISTSLDLLETNTGRRPRGWMGPGLAETMQTPQLLADLGVEYVLDWALDDEPVWMSTAPPVLALPYSLELNDSVVIASEHQPMGEYVRRVRDTAAVLSAESATYGPRVMSLPLHPHLLGVAHRFAGLMAVVDELVADPNVTFAGPGRLTDWYREQVPPTGT
jgi:allantoinase